MKVSPLEGRSPLELPASEAHLRIAPFVGQVNIYKTALLAAPGHQDRIRLLLSTMSHLPNAVEDIWAEESSEGYVDVTLQSAVVPSDGKLYVMFHGTSVEAAESIIKDSLKRSSDGTLGKGVYVSRQFEKAKSYPPSLRGQNVVLRVRVNVGKVIRIDRKGHPLQKTWHGKYDTAWIPPMAGVGLGQLEEDCVSNPNRIKVIDVDFAPSEQILRKLRGLIPYRNRRMQ